MSEKRSPPSGNAVPPSEYDLVLAAIPLLIVAGMALAAVTDQPLYRGLTVGSALALVPVAYGLFGRPPGAAG